MPPNYLLACRIDWQAIPPDSYVHQITALRHCAGLEFSQPITLFAGENGSGKSTLLTAMAVAFGLPSSGGTQNYASGQEEVVLAKAMRLIKGSQRPPCSYFFRADQFAALGDAAEAYQSNYGLRPLRQQSHGEGVLAFLQMCIRDRAVAA